MVVNVSPCDDTNTTNKSKRIDNHLALVILFGTGVDMHQSIIVNFLTLKWIR